MTSHEGTTFADLVDGGIGEACYDHEQGKQSEQIGLDIMPDDMIVDEMIELMAQAYRRGLRVGQAIADKIMTQAVAEVFTKE